MIRVLNRLLTLAQETRFALRRFWLNRKGVRLGYGARVGSNCLIVQNLNGVISIGDRAEFQHGVVLLAYGGRIDVGQNVFFGPYAVVYGHGGVEIGNDTLISMHCRILSSNHTVPPAGTNIRSQADVLLPTKIGRDVWLGSGVTVLGGVTIGDGCVVGAGAVVSRDLPPYSVATGVPAIVRRQRSSIA